MIGKTNSGSGNKKELFTPNDTHDSITGGWSAGEGVEIGETIKLTVTRAKTIYSCTNNPIDLTPYDFIFVALHCSENSGLNPYWIYPRIGIGKNADNILDVELKDENVLNNVFTVIGNTVYGILNVSDINEPYYVKMLTNRGESNGTAIIEYEEVKLFKK